MARALALNPDILLLDEPFGSLDEITRLRLDSELLEIWEKEKKTVLLVTHLSNSAVIIRKDQSVQAPISGIRYVKG